MEKDNFLVVACERVEICAVAPHGGAEREYGTRQFRGTYSGGKFVL